MIDDASAPSDRASLEASLAQHEIASLGTAPSPEIFRGKARIRVPGKRLSRQ
jgi:hypothetical protein